MKQIDETKRETRSTAKRIGRASLYLIPGYPIFKAAASAKEAISSGWKTIADQNRELAAQRKDPRSSTFNEAMARRPADALPLEVIERSCIHKKQFFMAIGFLSVSFLFGSAVGENYLGILLGVLFSMFCLMFAVKHEHQLWQLETGRASPDEVLGGYRRFFTSKGRFKRLVNPHLFR